MSQLYFAKPPLSLSDQVALLQSRGMQIPRAEYAQEMLLRLNYYRFSGYALHYEVFEHGQRTHHFHEGTTFDQVVDLYEFDTRLRALLFSYLEPVEIAFRSALCYELAVRSGDAHWYLNRTIYDSTFDYQRLLCDCQREYDRSHEVFIESYRLKYSVPPLPPAWMMSEILPMGCWSLIFTHLIDREAKKAVAHHLAITPHYLESWIHALVVLRNLCAHRCRIWNRGFTIKPALPKGPQWEKIDPAKLAALLAALSYLLEPLGKRGDYQRDWTALLAAFPNVPQDRMGFLP
ncbi:MAG: Abi family protein [Anaerolineae bacterium]